MVQRAANRAGSSTPPIGVAAANRGLGGASTRNSGPVPLGERRSPAAGQRDGKGHRRLVIGPRRPATGATMSLLGRFWQSLVSDQAASRPGAGPAASLDDHIRSQIREGDPGLAIAIVKAGV